MRVHDCCSTGSATQLNQPVTTAGSDVNVRHVHAPISVALQMSERNLLVGMTLRW